MDLPNLKDLKAILKLCRQHGVNKITLAEIIVEFGDMPTMIKGGSHVAIEEEEAALPAVPSDEDMLYWSSAPDPLAARVESE